MCVYVCNYTCVCMYIYIYTHIGTTAPPQTSRELNTYIVHNKPNDTHPMHSTSTITVSITITIIINSFRERRRQLPASLAKRLNNKYIYIYIEREREMDVCIIYIYIYMHIIDNDIWLLLGSIMNIIIIVVIMHCRQLFASRAKYINE